VAAPSARSLALLLLHDVLRRGQSLDERLAVRLDNAGLETRDRGFVRALVATTLRRLGQIDAVIAQFIDRPLPASAATVTDALRLGAAQLLFLATPAHAAVAATVDLVPETQSRYRGLVNAVLRRLAERGRDLVAAQDAARLNAPDWLWHAWVAAYGEATARRIAEANLDEAPLDLSAKADAALWANRLGGTLLPTGSIRRPAGGAVSELPGFAEGAWWVQDAAAALPARLLGDIAGRIVVDLCAAPGGKTAQLAAAGARVTAVEKNPARARRLAENLERLGLAAEIVRDDAATWHPPAPVDAVLLDAPCTATGTIRRHPDIPRHKRPSDVAAATRLQDRLLGAALAMLKPHGTLVYCVCSLQAEEGPARIAALLARGGPAARRPIDPAEIGGVGELVTAEGDLRTLPCHLSGQGGLDGFYAARLLNAPRMVRR
jgi:16S rRNA (cytosine967-C5)-methyltransferase